MYRQLGRSGLHLYPLALGTMQFGWSADEQSAFAIMDAFVEAGGNFIDTADIYSCWADGNPGGVSETIIGRWLQARQCRDRVLIATKVRGAMGEKFSQGRDSPYQREGLSQQWILRAVEDSLRRLQVDYIDLYQVHWLDPLVPIEETLRALDALIQRGYVRYIGCSNFSAWRLMQALWTSDKHNLHSFVSVQPEYNILSPTRQYFETEIAQVCSHYGLGVLPYSPLAGGFLTGKYQRDQPLPDSQRAEGIAAQRFSDKNWHILDTVGSIAEQHDVPMVQVALAWMLAKPFMSAPIVGANSVAQLQASLPAVSLQLSEADLQALDEASSWPRSRIEQEN